MDSVLRIYLVLFAVVVVVLFFVVVFTVVFFVVMVGDFVVVIFVVVVVVYFVVVVIFVVVVFLFVVALVAIVVTCVVSPEVTVVETNVPFCAEELSITLVKSVDGTVKNVTSANTMAKVTFRDFFNLLRKNACHFSTGSNRAAVSKLNTQEKCGKNARVHSAKNPNSIQRNTIFTNFINSSSPFCPIHRT